MKQRGSAVLHYLDRYLGIPAVATLGLLRRKRRLPEEIKSIGLLRLVAIGDTVLISGVAADLRAAFPRASITFFAGPTNYELAKMLDTVDRVVKVPVHNIAAGVRAVRSVPVDVMIDFGPWPRLEALLTLFSRASFTVGFETHGQHRHFGYDSTVQHSSEIHELKNFRALASPLDVRTHHAPRLQVSESGGRSHPYVVFHPWAAGKLKHLREWPVTNWCGLIKEFAGWDLNVVLTGGPSDHEANTKLISLMPRELRTRISNAADVSIVATSSLLAGASLVVSVNTGIMHIAAALGVPLVALHGPTSSKRWGPISDRAVVIDSPLAGCGYLNLGWENSGPTKCMECISYERVRDACEAMLDRSTAAPNRNDVAAKSGARELNPATSAFD